MTENDPNQPFKPEAANVRFRIKKRAFGLTPDNVRH